MRAIAQINEGTGEPSIILDHGVMKCGHGHGVHLIRFQFFTDDAITICRLIGEVHRIPDTVVTTFGATRHNYLDAHKNPPRPYIGQQTAFNRAVRKMFDVQRGTLAPAEDNAHDDA